MICCNLHLPYLSLTSSEKIVRTTSDVEKYQNAIFYGVVKLLV